MKHERLPVTVKAFRVYDGHAERPAVMPCLATPARIRQLGGEPIAGTERVVDITELDDHGEYRRVALGWLPG